MHAVSSFLEALVETAPYRIHTVLTDNGVQFADLPKKRQGPTARFRMNQTIKEATVKRYYYHSREQVQTHLFDFIDAYNIARRLTSTSILAGKMIPTDLPSIEPIKCRD